MHPRLRGFLQRYPMLFFGGQGARVFLHFDIDMSHVFHTHFSGRKLVVLFPPTEMLLYDRNTASLWSQIMAEAVSGPLQGTRLPQIPATHISWADCAASHPATAVLSLDTGFQRNYDRSPYGGYEKQRRLYFSVSNKAPNDLHPKELVLGVELDGVYKAYPFAELATHNRGTFEDRIGDRSVIVHWDEPNRSAHLTAVTGEVLPSTVLYWFAWYAFHPKTLVFIAGPIKMGTREPVPP